MMDYVLEGWVALAVERAKIGWMLGRGRPWRPGERLKLLFAGYNGTRNTGSDVRVEEMLRQVRQVLGEERVEFAVMSQNFERTRGYFGGARQVHLPDVFPPFLSREVPQQHGVIACEGSMFKSKFANALTVMMVGALGIAAAENKLSVGYGAEAGQMDPIVERMVARYCSHSLIITRNEESRAILRRLGVPTEIGTDTAWTFTPLPREYAERALAEKGWDGKAPVLVVCPINPFWWPVKASLGKYAARVLTGAFRESHYRTIYFHTWGARQRKLYVDYLGAVAGAVKAFAAEQSAFVILAAMERLDARACADLAGRLGGAPVFTSDDFNMYELVAVLRACRWMVSSRYHGIVTAMPGGVVSAGVTMDERIRNLMADRGHGHLLFEVDDAELEGRLLEAMRRMAREEEEIRDAIGRCVVRNLKRMARMGVYLEEHVQQRYPDFPVRTGLRSWEEYLPPFDDGLRRLVEQYDETAAPAPVRA